MLCWIVTKGSEIICIPVSLSVDRGGDLIGKNNVRKGATAVVMSTPNSQAPKSPNTWGQNGPQSHKNQQGHIVTKPKTPRGPAHCRGPVMIKNPRRGTKHTRRQQSPHSMLTATPARDPAQAKAPHRQARAGTGMDRGKKE